MNKKISFIRHYKLSYPRIEMDGKDKKNSMQAMIKGTPSKASSILKTL